MPGHWGGTKSGAVLSKAKIAAKRLAKDETLVASFDAELAPCRCTTHDVGGVACIVAGKSERMDATKSYPPDGTRQYRCLSCDTTWLAWYKARANDEY